VPRAIPQTRDRPGTPNKTVEANLIGMTPLAGSEVEHRDRPRHDSEQPHIEATGTLCAKIE
jgi:hypothetical protein